MSGIVHTPRSVALYLACQNASLEGRVAFAEAILPLVEYYDDHRDMIVYVDQIIPRGLPAARWIALTVDHLAFLCPEVPTLAGRAEADIAAARAGQ